MSTTPCQSMRADGQEQSISASTQIRTCTLGCCLPCKYRDDKEEDRRSDWDQFSVIKHSLYRIIFSGLQRCNTGKQNYLWSVGVGIFFGVYQLQNLLTHVRISYTLFSCKNIISVMLIIPVICRYVDSNRSTDIMNRIHWCIKITLHITFVVPCRYFAVISSNCQQ